MNLKQTVKGISTQLPASVILIILFESFWKKKNFPKHFQDLMKCQKKNQICILKTKQKKITHLHNYPINIKVF